MHFCDGTCQYNIPAPLSYCRHRKAYLARAIVVNINLRHVASVLVSDMCVPAFFCLLKSTVDPLVT